jgi:signal transduction histidine kinase
MPRAVAPTPSESRSSPRPTPLDAIPLHRRSVDLVRLIQSTLEPLDHEARALDVELRVDAPDGLAPVVVDPEKTAWVIATLVGNALRYVRRGSRRLPGGSVVVRVRPGPAPGAVEIVVEDDGPGIPDDKVRYLFERQAGSQHAIGLALTLVHDIVAAHGGGVAVESCTDCFTHGTAVRLTLPAGGAEGPPRARSST